MNAPNLFTFAPRELSQDAFFVWLFSFADKKYKNDFNNLHEVAQKLLLSFIEKCRPNLNIDIQTVVVEKQHNYIDILIIINDDFRILIESKTNSKEHSNQLKCYSEYAIRKKWDFIGIYLKTGNEAKCFLNQIPNKTKELGITFEIFNRQEILSVLDAYSYIDNDIFTHYLCHLQNIERKTRSFENLPIKAWYNRSWQGFYEYLDHLNYLSWWDYVPNPKGGFWGANFEKRKWQDYSIVFAIHQRTLVFGIYVTEKDKQTKLRNEFSQVLLKSAKEHGLQDIVRPSHFGKGRFMKVAEVKQEHWLGQDDDMIDLDKVVSILKMYQEFLISLSDN